MLIRSAAVCAAAFVAAVTIARPVQALTMQECSTKYKAAQAAGTLKGTKWNDFRKAECGPDASAATPATAPTNTVPAAPTSRTTTAAQPRTAPAAAGVGACASAAPVPITKHRIVAVTKDLDIKFLP